MTAISEQMTRLGLGLTRRAAAPATIDVDKAVAKAAIDLGITASRSSEPLDRIVLKNATHHNAISYHHGAEESFQAILDSLGKAKKSFHIETFIWHDDNTGRKLAQALVDKVKAAQAKGQKFDAKVIIDSMGLGSGYGTQDKNIVKFLNDNGVEARVFNPNYVSLKAMGIPLTHRKIYLADGEEYLVGGRNVGDEYFQKTYQLRFGDPKTTVNSYNDLLMKVRGDEAARVQGQFYKNWANAGGTVPKEAPRPVPAPNGHSTVETFVTDPYTGEKGIRQAHRAAIQNARHDIFVISPYFADRGLVNDLVAAKTQNTADRAALFKRTQLTLTRYAHGPVPAEQVQASVDKVLPELKVRALIPMSGEKGKDLNYEMDMMTAKKLLSAGAEVRVSAGGVQNGEAVDRFSHFKGMMVDHKVLSVGSANADHRTYFSNHEIINLVSDPAKVTEFGQTVAEPDWAAAHPIDLSWIAANTNWKERTLRAVGNAFSWLY